MNDALYHSLYKYHLNTLHRQGKAATTIGTAKLRYLAMPTNGRGAFFSLEGAALVMNTRTIRRQITCFEVSIRLSLLRHLKSATIIGYHSNYRVRLNVPIALPTNTLPAQDFLPFMMVIFNTCRR